jgi:hypothetical protein
MKNTVHSLEPYQPPRPRWCLYTPSFIGSSKQLELADGFVLLGHLLQGGHGEVGRAELLAAVGDLLVEVDELEVVELSGRQTVIKLLTATRPSTHPTTSTRAVVRWR